VLMLVLHIVVRLNLALFFHGARIFNLRYYAALFLFTGFLKNSCPRLLAVGLARVMNFWPAAAFLSVAFGYIHGANQANRRLPGAGFDGFFVPHAARTGDLGGPLASTWLGIGGESYLYSVPDSGALCPDISSTHVSRPDAHGGSVGPRKLPRFVVIGALWSRRPAYPK